MGTATNAAAAPLASKPGEVPCSRTKLMSSRLDPTSRTTESATSATMSVARKRPPRSLDEPRARSFNISTSGVREACSAGATPTNIEVISVMPPVKTRARQLSASNVFGGNCEATTDWMAESAHIARRIPTAPAAAEKTRLSTTNCLTTRARVAPRDWRTAISLCRVVRRPRKSDATFAQAMSSTKLTAPMSV